MTIVNVNDIIIIRCIFIFASFYNSGIYLNVWCVNVRRFKFTNVKLDKCKSLCYTINAVFDDIWQTGLYMRKSSRFIRLLFSLYLIFRVTFSCDATPTKPLFTVYKSVTQHDKNVTRKQKKKCYKSSKTRFIAPFEIVEARGIEPNANILNRSNITLFVVFRVTFCVTVYFNRLLK